MLPVRAYVSCAKRAGCLLALARLQSGQATARLSPSLPPPTPGAGDRQHLAVTHLRF
jgi:hypothetical protein